MSVINIPSKKIAQLYATTKNFYTVGPFKPTGGWVTPIYPDMRKVFTKPGNISIIADEIIKVIRAKKIPLDLVCGGATAGIPVATIVAYKLKKPFIYVRKHPKEGGLCLAVEGNWPAYKKGSRVLLIDDAYANGTSKKFFINNIRQVGLTIKHVIVVGKRGSPGGDRWADANKVTAFSLSSIDDMVNASVKNGTLSKEGRQLLKWYSQFPNAWHKDPEKIKFFKQYLKTHKKGSTKA
ncbi:hypothetical protein KKF61_06850 [Patescibacteria group bacterium]|nr:hypothetical protein [Patescibacteria group bacterium]MBU0963613.1 hypothetical protein [Patescibacteria group bacterium]